MARFSTDPELVLAAQQDQPGARDELLDACLPAVLAWCRRMGGAKVDPEDAAHDVLIVVITRISQLERPDRFEPWVYGITRRVLAGHRRRAWVRRWASSVLPEAVDPGPSPADGAELSQVAAEVQRVLQQLPAAQREVLVLCDAEDRTDEEAAALLDVPVGTVKSRLRLGRRRFRRLAGRREALMPRFNEMPSWGQG